MGPRARHAQSSELPPAAAPAARRCPAPSTARFPVQPAVGHRKGLSAGGGPGTPYCAETHNRPQPPSSTAATNPPPYLSPLTCVQVHGLAPWPVEAGPEFVHGRHSVFTALCQQLGASFVELDWPNWWVAGSWGQRTAVDAGWPSLCSAQG